MVGYNYRMNKEATKRQKELLEVIYRYFKDTGYPPTFEKMRENLGVSSKQSILDLLRKLEIGGLIRREEATARSITILPLGYRALGQPSLVPFLGVVSAGAPIEAIEITGEWQPVSSEVAELQNDIFLLKISGDSMINAGIDDGDVVLVKSEKEFVHQNIVLAEIGDEKTIKRFMSDDKPPYVYLKPENPKYPVIPFTEDMRLVGKVISVMKGGSWRSVK